MTFTVNMLLTSILYCDAGPGWFFFLSLPIPSSFLSLICIILMSSARGEFQEQKPTTRSLHSRQVKGIGILCLQASN